LDIGALLQSGLDLSTMLAAGVVAIALYDDWLAYSVKKPGNTGMYWSWDALIPCGICFMRRCSISLQLMSAVFS